MEVEQLIGKVETAFQCPDAKDIDDDATEKDGKPNGARALSKHEAQAIMAQVIAAVVQKSCKDGFTMDGPPGGHLKDPATVHPTTPEELDRTVHDEETLAREIDRYDSKY